MENSDNNTRGSNYLACEGSDEVFQMFCEICHKKGVKNVTADGFCINCLQYFCGNCLRFHKRSLPEHKHLDKYEMPQDFCSEFCEDHRADLVCFYCKSCDTFICRSCKTTMHQECEVIFVPEEVADLENTEDYKVYETMVAILETDLQKIKLSLDEDDRDINNIHQQALKTMRNQIKELLAKFDRMKMEIEDTFNHDQTRIEVLNRKLDTLSSSYGATKRQLNILKETGNKCKLYMMMKRSTSELSSLADDLEQIKGRESITQYQYEPDPSFMDLVQAHKFGYTVTNQTNEREKQTCELVETATVKPKQAKHQLSNSKETNSKIFQLGSIQDKVTATKNQKERSENSKVMQASIGIDQWKFSFKRWLPTISNEETTENKRSPDMTTDCKSRLIMNIPKKHRRKAEKQAVKEERERKYEERKNRKEEEKRRKEEEKRRKKQEELIQNLNKDNNILVEFFPFIIIITLFLVMQLLGLREFT